MSRRIGRARAHARDGSAAAAALAALLAAVAPGALLGAPSRAPALLSQPAARPRDHDGGARRSRCSPWRSAVGLGAPLALALRGRPERLLSALPWGITAALALAAAAQWAHAALFAYYLPPGINVRLLKAATVVSVLTVLCFYTALLHSMQRRPYGWRSRARSRWSPLLSLLLTAERRRGVSASRASPPLELGMRARPARTNLAVVALEGATLDAILPLAEQGQLPFLVDAAAAGRLRRGSGRSSPPVRVAVWRSVATGAYPFRHGVVSDRTYDAPFLRPHRHLSLTPWGSGFARWARPLGVRTERPAAGVARARAVADPRRRRARDRGRGLARHRDTTHEAIGPSAARSRSSTTPDLAARDRDRAAAPSGLRPSLAHARPDRVRGARRRGARARQDGAGRGPLARRGRSRSARARRARALRPRSSSGSRVCSRSRATRSAATPRSTSTATRERCSAKPRSS